MGKPAVNAPGRTTLQAEIDHYTEMLDLHDHLPINADLHPAQDTTMISVLGSPMMPLTTTDQPARASEPVKALRRTRQICDHVVVTGIIPALVSLGDALAEIFAAESAKGHDLESVLGTEGMSSVRLRKPTSGRPSTKISNHAWGTAIDFKCVGHSAPGNTGGKIPRFIAVMLPVFNAAGWYSGIGFHDTMHFEVSDATIRQWAREGRFRP